MRIVVWMLFVFAICFTACKKDDSGSSSNMTGHNGYIPKVKFDRFDPYGYAIYEENRLVRFDPSDGKTSVFFDYNNNGLLDNVVLQTANIDSVEISGEQVLLDYTVRYLYRFDYYPNSNLTKSQWLENRTKIITQNNVEVQNTITTYGQANYENVIMFDYDEFGEINKCIIAPNSDNEFVFEISETATSFTYQRLVDGVEDYNLTFTDLRPAKNPFYELYKQTGFAFFEADYFLLFAFQENNYGQLISTLDGVSVTENFDCETNLDDWTNKITFDFEDEYYEPYILEFSYH